jgi:hypothetical protein
VIAAPSDQITVKPVLLLVLSATLATAESRPCVAAAPQGPAESHAAEPAESPGPVTFAITHVEAGEPQIIRIFNLDEGTREIAITHMEASQAQTIRIVNPEEGTVEIVLPSAPAAEIKSARR